MLIKRLLTAVILNINTIVLRRLSIKRNMKLLFYSLCIAISFGLGLIYIIDVFGFEIIQLIFQRGAFTIEDTTKTYIYANKLSLCFLFIFITCTLFQPYLSLEHKLVEKESKIMASIFIISSVLVFLFFPFLNTTAHQNSFIMIYFLSTIISRSCISILHLFNILLGNEFSNLYLLSLNT